jgi:molybdate transport system substrate-binding protein
MGEALVNVWRAVELGLGGLAMLALVAAPARAAELKALVAGAVRDVVKDLAEEHTRATGVKADLFFGAMGPLKARIMAGERVDLVILTPVVFKEMIEAGRLQVRYRAPVGQVGMGVAVRKGVAHPGLGTADSFRRALLDAPALIYGDPKATSSGAYFARVIAKLGLADELRAKTRIFPDGHEEMAYLGKSDGMVIGVTQISEILANLSAGVELVGPFPSDLQNYTVYEAAVPSNAPSPEEAKALFDRLVGQPAQARFAAMGFEAVK